MSRFVCRLTALAASLGMVALSQNAQAGQLLAGAAKVSITPPAADFPFEAGNEKPFVGVHDDVFVRTLALDDSAIGVAVKRSSALPDTSLPVKPGCATAALSDGLSQLLASSQSQRK